MTSRKHTARIATATGAAATVAASVAFLLPSSAVAEAAQGQHRPMPSKPTVVLVHGAFADASGWGATAAELRREGFPVTEAANPLRGLAYDSAYLNGLLKSIKGPKIVVGHSYGGAVVTSAAADVPDVRALVYVAAFIPAQDETLGGLMAEHPDPTVPALPQQVFQFTRPDGSVGTEVGLDPAKFRDAFAADVPARAAADMAAAQRQVSTDAFSQPAARAAWQTIPSWALVAKNDHAIAPSLERFMAKRAGAHTTEINSSHAVMVSHPQAVADLIEQAYRATR